MQQWDAGPEKPQAWLREVVRKRISLTKWKASLVKNSLLSSSLSLGDLFNPATFINALRQQTARQLGTAIDMVKMICAWDKDMRRMQSDCPLPCVLSGLQLQGAMFHNGALQESPAESAVMATTPEVAVGFVPIKARETYESDMAVMIPVYLTPTREDHLTELQMPLQAPEDHDKWILSGVALFLSGDD